jgi:8-oxo-dGTP pyrophosphatase MutT (NUDIX family)
LYFFFGKENKYADTPGWSDFGGGTDAGESPINTAVREAGEELTGFLGDGIKSLILKKHLLIKNQYNRYKTYYMYIVPMAYDELLPYYYNNNQKFIQKRLPAGIIKRSKIFEKSEIKWVCIDDLVKMSPKFRIYFKEILKKILDQKEEIIKLFGKSLKFTRSKRGKVTATNKSAKLR